MVSECLDKSLIAMRISVEFYGLLKRPYMIPMKIVLAKTYISDWKSKWFEELKETWLGRKSLGKYIGNLKVIPRRHMDSLKNQEALSMKLKYFDGALSIQVNNSKNFCD